MRTEYEFILPRGYLDASGAVHRRGTMRLATARDELEPLRDPTINSADDPRLTIVVLARVVRTLGTLDLVTAHEIEGLFAADLAYLQDFYGVINFGTEDDIENMMEAQQELLKPPAPRKPVAAAAPEAPAAPAVVEATNGPAEVHPPERPPSRRSAIEEVPASGR
jgi:hypothetical protein